MRRFRPAPLILTLGIPALAIGAVFALLVRDPARFVHDLQGPDSPPCAELEARARRHHPTGLPCERYYCWNNPCVIGGQAQGIYSTFEADARASGFGDRIPAVVALFRQWTADDESAAHDWPAEGIDYLRGRAGFFDRVRIDLNRHRLAAYLSQPEEWTRFDPPSFVPRDTEEYDRLRALWRRNKLAPIAARLRKLAC